MQHYSLDYQYGMDITWFMLGNDNFIAQFSSGGAIVPEIIASRADANESLLRYFESLAETSETEINPLLDKYFNKELLRTPLEQYTFYAKKGLVSFDKINPGPGNSSIDYHLIARPIRSLMFDKLPIHIQELLLPTKQQINFQEFNKIDAGYQPWATLFNDYWVEPTFEKAEKRKKWGFM